MIWLIVFWICVFCLAHSYVLYPFLLKIFAEDIQQPAPKPHPAPQPLVSVLMAVYNEEKVVEQKIRSVFNTAYPAAQLEMWIGSDGSTDKTDSIIEQLIREGYRIHFKRFGGRNGKTQIINAMAPEANGKIFIPTDANIIFEPETIPKLVAHFINSDIGLVAANIVNTGLRKDGISYQEQTYIKRENLIKYYEGQLWGTMMGAFGACYAIRADLFPSIPRNFFMEDFYITLHVIQQGKKAIAEPDAVAIEDVSNEIKEEFKRKIRISAGNFQNLAVFKGLLLKPFTGAGYSFISHKVLRWFGPFFLIGALLSSILLFNTNVFFRLAVFVQLFGLITPLLDYVLSKMHIHIYFLRLLSYFYSMNLALLLGFVKYVKGIKSSVWSPTRRNV
jgi:cellulose synthase/poly-beta-1,6-N-acetylglucosamine synthase-like glycosyltransferase